MSDRLRAPSADGEILSVPPRSQAIALTHANRDALASADLRLLGRRLGELRHSTRQELGLATAAPLIVTGHQPELFHPGVWAKNFVAAGLARATQGQALNLVIDSDTLKSASLRVPHADGTVRPVAFDRWTGETSWEDRRVLDRDTFSRFGPGVMESLAHFGYRPLLADHWGELTEAVLGAGHTLGEAFTATRRAVERSLGVDNRETQLSRLWSRPAFAHLAGAILADLPRFHAVYNGAVRAYRIAHGIKSRAHPVPDLEVREGRHEAPFWIIKPGGRRERLFPDAAFPHPDRDDFVRRWCDLEAQGVRIRSRALTTTLAARLLLADLFIHGLGGGLYDALTDVLIREFFRIEPPGFLILTATRRLPIARPEGAGREARRLERLLRDLHYNPQRYQDHPASAEREILIRAEPTSLPERRERFLAIRRLNDQLREPLSGRIAQAQAALREAQRQQHTAAVLGRRDFSFVLFPESSFRPFLTELANSDMLIE